MTTFVDLAPAASRVARLIPGISDDDLAAPTPCRDADVGALISHLLGLCEAFRGGAEKAPDNGPRPGDGPAPPLAPDWRTALTARLDALVAAWRVPGALTGTTSVGGVEMPAEVTAVVALDELVLHGWDVALATGQPYEADPGSVQACLGFVAAAARPDGVPGLFGPTVPVAEDAPAFDRLLGLSGRRPGWLPPGDRGAG